MDKKKILITGASGLVGRHVIQALCHNYKVHALIRSKPKDKDKDKDIIYHEHDFTSNTLPTDLPNQLDGIIHLAQSNNFREFPSKALDIFRVNVTSTTLLLDYALQSGVTHFIFASTGGLYGLASDPFTEETPIQIPQGTLSYYFSSKFAAENLVQSYADLMSTYILRPFFIYGPNQKDSMLIPRIIKNIKSNVPITLKSKNGMFINPVHVNDVVRLIIKCLSINKSLTINVAGPSIISLREISETIGHLIGKKPSYIQQEIFEHNIIANNDKMKKILNHPLMTFNEGLETLVL